MFVHLHGHDHYSLLEGIGSAKKVAATAKKLGMESIAITDIGNMYGAIEFYQSAKKENIKPIIGIEISVVSNIAKKDPKEKTNNIVLLAKNYQGYMNLIKIVSIGNLDGFYQIARTDLEILQKHNEGIIAFMGEKDSQLGQMIMANEKENKLIDLIKLYKGIFNGEFYLEVIAQNYSKNKDIKIINDTILHIAKQTDTKVIVNSNFHYTNKDDKDAYEVLLSIKEGTTINARQHSNINIQNYILSEEEIIEILKQNGFEEVLIQELINNNLELANEVNLEIPLGKILFPKYSSPQNIKDLYETQKDKLVVEQI